MRTHMTGMLAIVALTMTLGIGSPARAADLTFDFTTGVHTQSSFSKTVSGFTLTFSDPQPNNFAGNLNGMMIGNGVTDLTQFKIVLTGGQPDEYLIFKNYEVGSNGLVAPANPFSLSGGTGTSNDNSLATVGTFPFAGSYSISQGQSVIFSSPLPATNHFSTLKTMTFTVAQVPEPSTWALGTIGTLTMAWLARRRTKGKG